MHLGTRSLVKEIMLGRRKKDKGNEVLEHELSLLAASNPEKLLESERVIREAELDMKLNLLVSPSQDSDPPTKMAFLFKRHRAIEGRKVRH